MYSRTGAATWTSLTAAWARSEVLEARGLLQIVQRV